LYGFITAVSSVLTDRNVGLQIGRNTSHGAGIAGGDGAPEAVALGDGRLPRSGIVSEGVEGEDHVEGVAGEGFEGVNERHGFADGRGLVSIFEAAPAVVLVRERGAQPRARVLDFALWQRVAGEGSAVVRVVQYFHAGGGGHGEVAAAAGVVQEGLYHGLRGGEVFGVDGDGGLDELERGGVGREFRVLGERGLTLLRKSRGSAGLLDLLRDGFDGGDGRGFSVGSGEG